MVSETNTPKNVPKGSRYAYHITHEDNVDSIVSNGLDPHQETGDNWRPVNELIKTVSYRIPDAAPLPVDRNNCAYLFDKKSTPISFVSDNSEYAVLVFDLSKVNTQLFVADMEPVTEMVKDHKNGKLPDSINPQQKQLSNKEQSYVQMIKRHLKSMTPAPNPAAPPPIDAYDVEWISPEPISNDAIKYIYQP